MYSSISGINPGVYFLARNTLEALKVAGLFMLATSFYLQVPTISRYTSIQN